MFQAFEEDYRAPYDHRSEYARDTFKKRRATFKGSRGDKC